MIVEDDDDDKQLGGQEFEDVVKCLNAHTGVAEYKIVNRGNAIKMPTDSFMSYET